MKVVVCGKGGSGKSTLTALIAKELAKRGFKVLVVDGDESNLSLHRFLGLKRPRELMDLFGSRKEVFERIKELKIERIDDIPEEFVSVKDRLKLVCIGKIHRFGEGCACPIGAILREFLIGLKLDYNEFVIVDTDAGVEHIGRGIEEGCDLILFVLDPTYESIELSKRIRDMKVEKPIFFVLNKLDERFAEIMRKNVDAISEIPFNEDLFLRCLKGEEVCEVDEVKELADLLVQKK